MQLIRMILIFCCIKVNGNYNLLYLNLIEYNVDLLIYFNCTKETGDNFDKIIF